MLTVVKFGGNQKLYVDFWLHGVSAPLIPMSFKGQLYMQSSFLDYVLKLTYLITSPPPLSKVLVILFKLFETVGLCKRKNILNLIITAQMFHFLS